MQPEFRMTLYVPACELRTARLIIRCKRASDAPLLKHAVDSSLDHLRQWMPWAMHEPSELWVIEERIARFQVEFQSGQDRTYGIFNLEETEILGGIGLHPTGYLGTLELGYWLRADQTGQGLATEAAAALTQAAFTELGAQRIEIRCDPRNLRSARVPERLGFRMEEVLIAGTLNPAGEPRDTMVWAMTAEEFTACGLNSTA
jgi:RimJ/RimL family protein N-acetyltransferase